MHEELLQKLAEAEFKLDFKFPASIRRFLASLEKWEYQFKDQVWYFNIVHDINDPDTNTSIIENSRTFRDEWRLKAVVIAHNGLGDYMLLLPNKTEPELMDEMLYVMWHEVAQIRVLSWNIDEAVRHGLDEFIYRDECVYALDDQGNLVEGYELRRLEDPGSYVKYLRDRQTIQESEAEPGEPDLVMELHNQLQKADGWIDEERTDKISEILSTLHACVEEGTWSKRAHLVLNRIYMKGFGIPANPEKAIYHAIKSAEEGNYNAMSDLAFYYFKGMGVEQNFQTSLYWMQKANDASDGMFIDKLELIQKMMSQNN